MVSMFPVWVTTGDLIFVDASKMTTPPAAGEVLLKASDSKPIAVRVHMQNLVMDPDHRDAIRQKLAEELRKSKGLSPLKRSDSRRQRLTATPIALPSRSSATTVVPEIPLTTPSSSSKAGCRSWDQCGP